MEKDQLIAEIKKQLQEEMKNYAPAAEQALEFKDEVEELIEEHPWVAVGVAATVGFMLARLIYKRG